MAANTETGHAKNAAGLKKLIVDVQSFGSAFDPSEDNIKIPALQAVEAALDNSLETVIVTEDPYKKAINARQAAFKPMSPLTTRMKNALEACKASPKEIKDGISLSKKVKGERIDTKRALDAFIDSTHKAGAPVDPTPTTDTTHEELIKHSVSQLGFENRIQNFKRFVTYLTGVTKYNPNETDLKIVTLTTYSNSLQPLNNAVNTTFTPLYHARVTRDTLLYATDTGVHDLVQQVKSYVKSAFGIKSPEYKLISKIQIKVPKKK